MSSASLRRERWAGLSGLSIAFAVGGALLAFLLTRPFFDWREDQFWQGIYVELAFFDAYRGISRHGLRYER